VEDRDAHTVLKSKPRVWRKDRRWRVKRSNAQPLWAPMRGPTQTGGFMLWIRTLSVALIISFGPGCGTPDSGNERQEASCANGITPGCGFCYPDASSSKGGTQTCWTCNDSEYTKPCVPPPPCGGVNEVCCLPPWYPANWQPCTDPSTQCEGSNICRHCGNNGEACCNGSGCGNGLGCDSGSCQPCGGNNQNCCDGNTCAPGYTCSLRRGGSGTWQCFPNPND
jgi:hypothetical protein